MAMTADGKIATAARAASSFGSRRDHDHLLTLRTTADAVMAGARTVDSNPVNLGPGGARYQRRRMRQGLGEYNLRVVVSGSGSVNPEAEVFRHGFSPILVLTTGRAKARRLARLRRMGVTVKVCGRDRIHFRRALEWLWSKWKVRRLLCEGGGELNDALFRAGLVDELHLTVCPRILGGRAAPTVADGVGARQLALSARLELKSGDRVGEEMFLVYGVRKGADRGSSPRRGLLLAPSRQKPEKVGEAV